MSTSAPDRQTVSCNLRVGGMDCPSCAASIDRALTALAGVQDVQVDVVGGTVRVRYAPDALSPADLSGTIRHLGYTADEAKAQQTIARPDGRLHVRYPVPARRKSVLLVAASGILLVLGVALTWFEWPAWITVPPLALSVITGGWLVFPRALRAVKNRALDMNVLMSVAAIGAAVIGQWGEAASAMFLFAVAQLLEARAMDRARGAIRALMELSPAEATVRRDGLDLVVPASEVVPGERILLKPGQRAPLDGVVIRGTSAVDQAPITGESMPVDKEPGAELFAGSINGHGALEIRVTKHARDSTLSRIIHTVEEAQASRAPTQSFVDRFARVYTPAVVGLAVLIAVLPPLFGAEWGTWIYRSLTMLVIACPCALVISTPVTIVSALAGAARRGVLIKGGAYLERAGTITTVVFDKTGTLTHGRPVVTDMVSLDGHDEALVLQLAAAVEQHSEHPLAQAVLAAARGRGLSLPEVRDFEALSGRGARALVNGQVVVLGNERLSREMGHGTPAAEAALAMLESRGKTAFLLMNGAGALGIIAMADQLRPEALASIHALRRAGVRRIILLTGDNEGTARAVARELGIHEYRSGLLPSEKADVVRRLVSSGERVAVVGDGVNDAPALAVATVGVAMGAAGSDVAIETADVALMGDDLSRLPLVMRLSSKAVAILKQNIAFAIAIKAVFLLLAAFGWATLWMAVAADMGASLIVVGNGLRALHAGR